MERAIIILLLKSDNNSVKAENYFPGSLIRIWESYLERTVSLASARKDTVCWATPMWVLKTPSATYELIYLENTMQNNFIERKHMVAVLFDLNKAFDQMW